MKKILAITAALALGVNAYAGLNISWIESGGGITRSDGTTALLDSGSALFQLIFSTDNSAGAAGTDGSAAGDTILDQLVVDQSTAGNDASFFASQYNNATFTAGYVFLRVFDIGTSIGNTPGNTWYLTGPAYATQDLANNATPQQVDDGVSGGGPNPSGSYRLNTQVVAVPEPTVFAFLGIGGMLIAARRMRKA